jgi:hypothetical protein
MIPSKPIADSNILFIFVLFIWCCAGNSETQPGANTASTGDADSDTDTDADSDSDADSDTDADADGDTDTKRSAPWADITDVTVSGSSGSYTFSATVHSTDIDCSEFANWWEVTTQDGTLLYRRILQHPHTPAITGNPVTRSGGPVPAAGDQEVIVRAHLNTVGYVGIPMRGTAESGFEAAPDITSDFHPELADEEPQPATCIPEETFGGG